MRLQEKIDVYYDYLHNFLSVESFAEYYDITKSMAKRFINDMYFLDEATDGFTRLESLDK